MGTCQYNNCKSYIDISTLNTTVNIIDQLNNDFMVVHEDYEHPLYGQVNILEYKEPKQYDFKLVHKLITFTEQEDFQYALQYYQAKFYGFNHPNLLIIHAMQYKQIDQFFTTEYKLSLFLDYYETTLAQELIYRKKIYFEETEILFFLDSLIGSQAFLQSKGYALPSLKFDKVYLSNLLNGAIGLKVQSPLFHNQQDVEFNELFHKIINGEEVRLHEYPYITPEQWLMIQNKQLEPYNEFKSNVFILGLMTLELCSAKQSITLYQDYMIDPNILIEQINKVNDRYGEALPLILEAMLHYDPKDRRDFLQLNELLDSSQLKGKRLAQIWTSDDYQYSLTEKKVHFSTKQHSLVHPEVQSQLSNQSLLQKGSHLSIRQVISKNSKESKASSSFIQKKESYSPQIQKKNLFKKFETEQASKGGSKKLITQDGFGVETTPNGLTYEGFFNAGKKQGMGKLINDENEIIYEGYFHENQFHRTGILKNQNAQICQEAFNYKDFNQLGEKWARYDGDFNFGQQDGYGQLVLTNAERYTGLFKNGKVHGAGVFQTLDGKQIKGVWINNILQEQ
ncbi:unnamed protein product [Paramecium primaurelia]|uniref:Protein kinase domain-containing protein n=1 Tax=Paramecium primaurelia TaxID=5886 RepID=A0A8S1NT19_PARPR|nr:unnamed protein product [Paramecium primaurelia]